MASSDEKIVNVVIKYATQGAEEARQSVADLNDPEVVAAVQKAIPGAFSDATKAANDFAKQTQDGFKNTSEQVRTFSNTLKTTEEQFHSLRQAGFELRQIGTVLTIGGGLLTAGIVADANNYVKAMGQTTELSSQWLGYENQIKQANLEIGQTAAQAVLPVIKTAATLMQDIADIIKANPWIISAALGVGGAMTAIGVTATVVAEVVRVVADVGLLLGKLGLIETVETAHTSAVGADTAALAEHTAALTGTSAAASAADVGSAALSPLKLIGIILAGAFYQFTALTAVLKAGNDAGKALENELVSLGVVSKSAASAFDDQRNSVLRLLESLPAIGSFFKSIYGDVGQATPSAAPQSALTQQSVQEFINFQKSINDAQATYSQNRADIISQYEQQIADTTAQYESQRADIVQSYSQNVAKINTSFADQQAKALQSYNDQQAKALQSYNDQQAKAMQQYQLQSQRSAQQHAIEMQRLEEAHNSKMNDLAAARDALGLVKEQQSYQQQVSQKNQDYSIQQQQARQNFEIQRADAARAFAQQQADAEQAHQQQLADAEQAHQQQLADAAQQEQDQLAKLDENHKLEMAKLDQQEKDKLTKLDDAYKKQIDILQTAFIDRLNALDSNILGDTAAFNSYMKREAQALQQWIDNFKANAAASTASLAGAQGFGYGVSLSGVSTLTTHQAGGYANFSGPGEDGMDEFVLRNSTTRAMESIMGGRLTQENLLSTMMANRLTGTHGGGGNMNITVTGGSLTISEIRGEINNALNQKLGDLLPAFGVG